MLGFARQYNKHKKHKSSTYDNSVFYKISIYFQIISYILCVILAIGICLNSVHWFEKFIVLKIYLFVGHGTFCNIIMNLFN